ncbi:hypothetical protein CRG98_040584 [Punica granatum]|uniref:Uncharacterized protein n=1 Tax=Punica granatum TaxID=22663 RepID=A0A2I0I4W6_PUNGR|nr:hypothetical protein CRG98_040584 [Punica granatum]
MTIISGFVDILGDKENETPRSVGKERQSVRTRVSFTWPISSTIRCFYRLIVDSAISIVISVAKHFEPEPISHAYHEVQHPKPSTTGSNTPTYTERAQPECGMGSSLESPLYSEIPDRRARGPSVEPVKLVYCYQEMSKLDHSRSRFAQGIDHYGSTNCNSKIVNRLLEMRAYSSFEALA